MSIPSITGVGQISASIADPTAASATARKSADVQTPVAASTDDYKAPTPPRFPWLSRLALQLEAASDKKPGFPPAPVLGDHLNQSA